ncbi:MAG: PhoD-like phosphatase N-terminal domain-containing protein, partial [Phenylobacterium sp.]|nr:PhoD-like phosphatase N-terminal domain-containing protein [Phenylobacterium sp.]
MRIDRRQALVLFGAGTAAAPGPALAQDQRVRFDHGVASGDPTADRVILWTRITPMNPSA